MIHIRMVPIAVVMIGDANDRFIYNDTHDTMMKRKKMVIDNHEGDDNDDMYNEGDDENDGIHDVDNDAAADDDDGNQDSIYSKLLSLPPLRTHKKTHTPEHTYTHTPLEPSLTYVQLSSTSHILRGERYFNLHAQTGNATHVIARKDHSHVTCLYLQDAVRSRMEP